MKDIILIGYSGHAFVIADAIFSNKGNIFGYCDSDEKSINPFGLKFLGPESIKLIQNQDWIVSIGDNKIREKIVTKYIDYGRLTSVYHKTCTIGAKVQIKQGSFLAASSTINSLSYVGNSCIINTGAIIEHECKIGDFCHIAPGAVLAGNVKVGDRTFIGANSVVKQGAIIGKDVIVGAGSVIINDIPDGNTVVGNPGKTIKSK